MFPIPPRAVPLRAAFVVSVAALLAACGSDDGTKRGEVSSDAAVATLTAAQIDATTASPSLPIQALTGTAKCDVTVRKVVHTTAAPNGGGDGASTAVAAVLVPTPSATCAGPFPIVAYDPGTNVEKARTLASPTSGETVLLAAFFAAQGYVVVATDYLGFSDSNLSYHPYLHAESQATTTIDAIRAASTVLARLGVPLSGKLFLTGYSQGGHAAMATHRAIEADPSLGLTVTAAGPMSGPYNLSGSFVAGLSLLPSGSGGSTVFTPYAITGYQKIYGNLYATAADFFKAPYANGIESLLPGAIAFNDLFTTGRLPLALGDLLTPRAIADVTDTSSGLRRALDANTLLGWTPRAPVLLCGGSRDPVVLYSVNTTASAQDITARGGRVTAIDVEQVPEFASALPPANTPVSQLTTYHGTVVPPLCMKVVRDALFATLR